MFTMTFSAKALLFFNFQMATVASSTNSLEDIEKEQNSSGDPGACTNCKRMFNTNKETFTFLNLDQLEVVCSICNTVNKLSGLIDYAKNVLKTNINVKEISLTLSKKRLKNADCEESTVEANC